MRKKPAMGMTLWTSVALCLLAGLATALQLVSFATHAWAVWTDKHSGRTVYIGLWYSVICDGWSGYCASISHHDEHINNLAKNLTNKDTQYSFRVGSQVNVTLALFCSIFGAAFTVLTARSARNKHQFRLGAVVALFLSGCFLLTVIGTWTGEILSYIRIGEFNKSNNIYLFPWSLLVGGLGGIFSVITGLTQLVLLCLHLRPKQARQGALQTRVYTSAADAPSGNGNDSVKHEYIGLDLRKPELLNNCSDCNVYKDNEKCDVL